MGSLPPCDQEVFTRGRPLPPTATLLRELEYSYGDPWGDGHCDACGKHGWDGWERRPAGWAVCSECKRCLDCARDDVSVAGNLEDWCIDCLGPRPDTRHHHARDYLTAIHHLAWLTVHDADEACELLDHDGVTLQHIASVTERRRPGPHNPAPFLRAAIDLLDLAAADGCEGAGDLAQRARKLLEAQERAVLAVDGDGQVWHVELAE